MPRTVRNLLHNDVSYDEPDRMPDVITIGYIDIIMYGVAIAGHFFDLGLDINVAVRYSLAQKMMEFGWTLAFILLPAIVNTAIYIRMYSQDKKQDSPSNEFARRKWLRVFILVLQMAPILRFMDALIYAVKSQRAERNGDQASQIRYYKLMLKEDSDAALLRIFECFLEAAPQLVLQLSLLLQHQDLFNVHQILSMMSSLVSMAWCLAAYQRSVRFVQEDKDNMSWLGTAMQTVWHYLLSLSRVVSLSLIAYLFPYWTLLACFIHILTMANWIQVFEQPTFCSQNKLASLAFSLVLGAVYLFTYIQPADRPTRYRFGIYYSLCFMQNVACCGLWYFFAPDLVRYTMYFIPLFVLTVVPYVVGLIIMVIYYSFVHPKVRKGAVADTVSFNAVQQITQIR